MTEVFTTSGAVLVKAGANANATLKISGAAITRFLEEGEAFCNLTGRYDFTTNWASLTSNSKAVLAEAVANLAAIYLIQYDMSGYTSRVEAEDMINVLWARFNQCMKVIKDQKSITYL